VTTTLDPRAATLFEAADAAGALLRDAYLRDGFVVHAKGTDDLVTSADREAEALIVRLVRARFPDHRIVAEEAGLYEGSAESVWYIDPLDGTLNFANHLGSWSTSLAVVEPTGPVAAAVVDPLYGEAFRAAEATGATLNGGRMAVRHLVPSRAIVHAYVGGTGPWQQPAAAVFTALAPRVRRLRILGSLALALAYVAAGRLDAVVQLRASS
jgi:myo-inositol-1(or 4)-monophosphatase